MNKNAKNIKTLRENFIKRHQLDPDFFTLPNHRLPRPRHQQLEEYHLLHQSPFPIKNSFTHPPLKSTPFQHQYRHSLHAQPTSLKSLNTQVFALKKQIHYIPREPIYVKVDKLKKRSLSMGEGLFLPKYVSSLMKTCSVETAKISTRPQSAFSQSKSDRMKPAKPQSRKFRKKSQFLQPWEVDYEY